MDMVTADISNTRSKLETNQNKLGQLDQLDRFEWRDFEN